MTSEFHDSHPFAIDAAGVELSGSRFNPMHMRINAGHGAWPDIPDFRGGISLPWLLSGLVVSLAMWTAAILLVS